ncbi:MarR family winged helix-turn-helix transcriptional regulator [Paenibacillus validus]|uniref:MarR family winged helix-turn-helix transcriptional regulator n=1 Tax=Paenibacillus validus TaxID=44253 RepID=UPI003D2E3FB4
MPSQSINRLWRSLLDLDRGLKQTLCLLSQEAEVPASAVALVFKLEHEDSLKVNDVATVLGITIGAASNLIDKLEEKQWVERVRSEEDRRIMYVRLTGLGMEQLAAVEGAFCRACGSDFCEGAGIGNCAIRR